MSPSPLREPFATDRLIAQNFCRQEISQKNRRHTRAELLIASHKEWRKATSRTVLQQLPTFLAATKKIYLSFFNLLQF